MEKIRARLVVHNIGGMTVKELKFFRKWIQMVATELDETDPEAFNQKMCRWTLYEQDELG